MHPPPNTYWGLGELWNLQANKVSSGLLILISLVPIITSPYASLVLQIRLCTAFTFAVLVTLALYTNNMQQFTSKLQLYWMNEKQAVQRERLVERKLQLQLQVTSRST